MELSVLVSAAGELCLLVSIVYMLPYYLYTATKSLILFKTTLLGLILLTLVLLANSNIVLGSLTSVLVALKSN